MTTLTPVELISVGFFTVVVFFNMAIGLNLILYNRKHFRAVMFHLQGIEHTHKLGFEALVMDINRLRTRVEALELRTGLGSSVDKFTHNS